MPNGAHGTEIIEVAQPALPAGALWQPVIGVETTDLLSRLELSDGSRDVVRQESVRILSRGPSPTNLRDSSIGLVMGYVQSGKTLSFTTVAALARDNGFQMIIVIAGTSRPLFDQSKDRLLEDLGINNREDRKWHHLENPNLEQGAQRSILGSLADWRDNRVPDTECQTVLITVMKNHSRLRKLTQVLERLDLRQVPALIVDDEADQAGLNTRIQQGEQSTTYRRLLDLRAAVPIHLYLQYTATPQAPLLINIIDSLSPRFSEVLTPGDDYIGGRTFFVDHANLVRPIPIGDVPSSANPIHEPPLSLLEAMRIFFLGVAAGMTVDGSRGNRSMLVHPSRETAGHAEYFRWTGQVMESWRRLLALPETDPDRQELLNDFRSSYDDLAATVPNLPGFEALNQILERAIRKTELLEVNAVRGQTPSPDWRNHYSHLLVGGQAMDRGFTVEGLTITYMPRGMGLGNADTLQQRARFLGYKRRYIGYCRVYLEVAALRGYQDYVEHEEDLRSRINDFSRTGRPMIEWRRAFFLDGALEPTRRAVLDLDYMRGQYSDQWFNPVAPHDSAEAVEENRTLTAQFLSRLALGPDPGHAERTSLQRHRVAEEIPLSLVFTEYLTRFRMTRAEDSQDFTGVLLQIKAYIDATPQATCSVYQMSSGEIRERTVDDHDCIPNLFQGAHPSEPVSARGTIYPGDRYIRSGRGLTVQVHRINILRQGGDSTNDVPTIAIWIPRDMARGWLIQEQPSQYRA